MLDDGGFEGEDEGNSNPRPTHCHHAHDDADAGLWHNLKTSPCKTISAYRGLANMYSGNGDGEGIHL